MILKRGQHSDNVSAWQRILVKHGHKIVVDGIFGPDTEAATKALQTKLGVQADGIVGPATLAAQTRQYPWMAVAFNSPSATPYTVSDPTSRTMDADEIVIAPAKSSNLALYAIAAAAGVLLAMG